MIQFMQNEFAASVVHIWNWIAYFCWCYRYRYSFCVRNWSWLRFRAIEDLFLPTLPFALPPSPFVFIRKLHARLCMFVTQCEWWRKEKSTHRRLFIQTKAAHFNFKRTLKYSNIELLLLIHGIFFTYAVWTVLLFTLTYYHTPSASIAFSVMIFFYAPNKTFDCIFRSLQLRSSTVLYCRK